MNELFDKKWEAFEKRSRLFKYIPFVEFVLLAGSMATGKVHEKSDFDVILGVRNGRVFTSWFFSALFFEVFRWREKPGRDATDKFGMSHFAAPGGYKLSGPYDAYWENLYRNLIPVMGHEKRIEEFFIANDWLSPRRVYVRHERYLGGIDTAFKKFLEFILGGSFGNFAERYLKKWLVKKIKDPAKLGHGPRVHWSDEKLELYRDTRRIEEMIKRKEV